MKNINKAENMVKTNRYFYLSNYYSSENKEDEDYNLFISLSRTSKLLNSKGLMTSANFSSSDKRWEFQKNTTLLIHFYREDIEWTEMPALFTEDIKSKSLSKLTYIGVDLLLKKVNIFTGDKIREINFKEFKDVISHHKFIEVYLTKDVLTGKGYDSSVINFLTK